MNEQHIAEQLDELEAEPQPSPESDLRGDGNDPSNGDAEDSSSSASVDDKGSGKGGYSGDNSASDQSSDDTTRVPKKLALNRVDLSLETDSLDDSSDPSDARMSSTSRRNHSHSKASHHRAQEASRQPANHNNNEDVWHLMPLRPLPQRNGVRIVDPRLDLSSGLHKDEPHHNPQATTTTRADLDPSEDAATQVASMEFYKQILDVCHPFHREITTVTALKSAEAAATAGNGSEGTHQHSSEGFTSYFTTTHSSSNNGSSCSDLGDQKQQSSSAAQYDSYDKQQQEQLAHSGGDTAEDFQSGSRERERRVRIQDAADNTNHKADDDANESSMSSESSTLQDHASTGDTRRVLTHVSRVVTGSSSNSGGNTNSGSNSAGSTEEHNVSSGSGNDKGSSEEGKCGAGGSEDVAGNGASGGCRPNQEEPDDKERTVVAAARSSSLERYRHAHETNHDELTVDNGDEGSTRERKLHDKKRKRIEMRREYEAQQQVSDTFVEANSTDPDVMLRPGIPTTLEHVLQFSKVARILVQSKLPFLVVHTNAAYGRLTGIDSHKIVGKPIRALLSVQEPSGHLVAPADAFRTSSPDQRIASLERLVVSGGFGKMHTLLVHAASIQLPEANMTDCKDGGRLSSLNDVEPCCSHEQPTRYITCKASIAPIVSSLEVGVSSHTNDIEQGSHQQKLKNKKHDAYLEPDADGRSFLKVDPVHLRRHHHPARVTHFVVQVCDICDDEQDFADSLSTSSTSVEARLLGLTKDKVKAQRAVTNPIVLHETAEPVGMQTDDENDHDAGAHSDSTEHTRLLPLTAIG